MFLIMAASFSCVRAVVASFYNMHRTLSSHAGPAVQANAVWAVKPAAVSENMNGVRRRGALRRKLPRKTTAAKPNQNLCSSPIFP
jgi:hypothetical protein